VIFLAVVVLTWHGYWMQQHARAVKGDIQRQIDEAQATHRMWVIGVIAFTGVFREGAETVLFMWGLLTQATTAAGWASALGALLGLVMAASLGWAIFRGGQHVSLKRFFGVTSVFLLLFAVQLLLYAFHESTEANLLPIDNAYWHLATEPYGPEGEYGAMLTYALVLVPAAWLAVAGLKSRFARA